MSLPHLVFSYFLVLDMFDIALTQFIGVSALLIWSFISLLISTRQVEMLT